MRAIEILMDEHRVIEQVLSCLEKMADLGEREGRIEAGPARDAVDFFRTFADHCHHAKEEAELFPLMEAQGFSPVAGPTAVMRQEHEQGRGLIRGIDEAIEGAAAGGAEAIGAFVRNARAYAQLLRGHIQKEDHCLFPMADQALQANDRESLLQRFDEVDREELGREMQDKYRRMADALAERFGVPRAGRQTRAGGRA